MLIRHNWHELDTVISDFSKKWNVTKDEIADNIVPTGTKLLIDPITCKYRITLCYRIDFTGTSKYHRDGDTYYFMIALPSFESTDKEDKKIGKYFCYTKTNNRPIA